MEPRVGGLHTVLSSYFDVKVTGKEAWIHQSQVKQLPEDHSVDKQRLVEEESTVATVLEIETICISFPELLGHQISKHLKK